MRHSLRKAVVERVGRLPCGKRLLTIYSMLFSLQNCSLAGVCPSLFTKKISGFKPFTSSVKSKSPLPEFIQASFTLFSAFTIYNLSSCELIVFRAFNCFMVLSEPIPTYSSPNRAASSKKAT